MAGSVSSLSVTDMSGTITDSGTTATLTVPEGAEGFEVHNPSSSTLWARWGGSDPAANAAGSFAIASLAMYSPPAGVKGVLKLLSTAASQTYTASRFS